MFNSQHQTLVPLKVFYQTTYLMKRSWTQENRNVQSLEIPRSGANHEIVVELRNYVLIYLLLKYLLTYYLCTYLLIMYLFTYLLTYKL